MFMLCEATVATGKCVSFDLRMGTVGKDEEI